LKEGEKKKQEGESCFFFFLNCRQKKK